MLYFTSDSHWGHANIIKYCKRPFNTVEEMNEGLIKAWNSVVGTSDTVYHLGDFAFGKCTPEEAANIASRLNGDIHLVRGNHEEIATQYIPQRFLSIQDYLEIKHEKQLIVMCHYAFRTWRHDLRGAWHLYGHSHGELPGYGKSLDVGVDSIGLKPWSFDQIKVYMRARPIGDHPQFKNFTGSGQ